jgi:hypothetical protein
MTTKKKTTKKSSRKPKQKVVVRYVTRKETNPLGNIGPMVSTGASAIIGLGIAGAIGKALKE